MASTSTTKVVASTEAFTITKVTVTWDNADLTAQDIVHGGPKGLTPVPLGSNFTTAPTNNAVFTYTYDNTNGEVDIVALPETGGSIASGVSEHCFLFVGKGDQDATSITP